MTDKLDAENLANVVDEYLHWRRVNPQIKGGENYLKRLRDALPKPQSKNFSLYAEIVTNDPLAYARNIKGNINIEFIIPQSPKSVSNNGEAWRDILKEKPSDGECVLVASIQNEQSVVEFGEYYLQDGKHLFRLHESSGVVAATHWLRIPELPPIHNLKHIGHA